MSAAQNSEMEKTIVCQPVLTTIHQDFEYTLKALLTCTFYIGVISFMSSTLLLVCLSAYTKKNRFHFVRTQMAIGRNFRRNKLSRFS